MRDVWVRLAHVGMHPERLGKLLRDAGSPEEVLEAITRGKVTVPPAARAAAEISASERRSWMTAHDVSLVLKGEKEFPECLAELPDSPSFLFQRGTSVQHRAVAIVGTRSCTTYGKRLAFDYGHAVSEAGWTVVSGLARGIDGAAHRGSLSGGTPGIAVLGSGIDVWYPSEHTQLGGEILDAGGTIWSESPPGTPPVGWRFPPRNKRKT